METDFKKIDDEKQMLLGIYFPVLRQYLMAKKSRRKMFAKWLKPIGNETDSTYPPSDEYLPVDEGDDYGPEELSYTDLIEELEQDISEYEFLNNKML